MAKKAIRKFFTEAQEEQIIHAIRQAELNTSGEVRVHIEENCAGDAVDRATQIFGELNMHETELRNGILFYIASEDHKFAVVGDQGIHEHVHDAFWQEIRDEVIDEFKAGHFAAGLEKGILHCGEALKEHFPYQDDDINELPDEISTS